MESQPSRNGVCDRPTQDLVRIILDTCANLDEGTSPQLKQQLCRSASVCLETSYRSTANLLDSHLTANDYARLVEQIACGGKVQQQALTD